MSATCRNIVMMGKHNEEQGVKDIYDYLSDRWRGRAGVRKGQDQDQDEILRTKSQIYVFVTFTSQKGFDVITVPSSCCSLKTTEWLWEQGKPAVKWRWENTQTTEEVSVRKGNRQQESLDSKIRSTARENKARKYSYSAKRSKMEFPGITFKSLWEWH